MNRKFTSIYTYKHISLFSVFFLLMLFILQSCKEPAPAPPEIKLIFDSETTAPSSILAIGRPIKFKIEAKSLNTNITNFTIKKVSNNITKTMLDSGLNSAGFLLNKTFYQGVEDAATWVFTVMDRNRQITTTNITIYKDPNSTYGGIIEYPLVCLGYQSNTNKAHFFISSTGQTYMQDSASMFQNLIDILVYYNEREENGIMKACPNLSSPGEEANASGELYDIHYPYLKNWTTRNYTKFDIRANNGVDASDFDNCHNDSLLITSYDDAWGKRKYKWADADKIIPFQVATGKKGLIKIISADHNATGEIKFAVKIQL